MLHLADGERIEQVILAAFAVLVLAADDEIGFGFGERLERVLVLHLRFAREHVQADALDTRGGAGEVGLDERLVEADSLEDLRAAITLQRGDAHLREGFEQALVDGLNEVLLGILGADFFRQQAAALQVVDGLDGEVGVDGACAVADEERKVHHFARLAALDDQRNLGALLLLHKSIVDRGHGQKTGDRRISGIDAAIGDD